MNEDNHIPYHASNSGKIYFSNFLEHYIIDNYKNNSLPLNGWIKNCFICYSITENHIFKKYKNNKIGIPLCKKCSKNNSDIVVYFLIEKLLSKYTKIN